MISVEDTIDQHIETVKSLPVPDLLQFDSDKFLTTSPYIYKFKLNSIKNDAINVRSHISTSNIPGKRLQVINDKLSYLLSDLIDEKLFIVDKMIVLFNNQCDPKVSETQTETSDPDVTPTTTGFVSENAEDISLLRKRLLSGGTATSLDDTDKNEYHDNLQSDLLQDLSELTNTLKNGALNFSHKILGDDLSILNETNENIIKNSSLFKVIDKNLSGYLENKTGGKVGLFWILKVTALLVIGFLFMVLIIKIIPQIG